MEFMEDRISPDARPEGGEGRRRAWRGRLLALAAAATLSVAAANDWENPAVNSTNRESARAYSMPLADEKAALTDDLEPATPDRKSVV